MPDPRRSKRFLHKVQSKQPGMTRALKGCCSALFRRTFTRNCLDTKQLELLSQELQRDYFDTSMFADHPAAPRCGSSDRSTCRRSQSPFGLPSRSPAPPLRESECSAARPRTEFAGGGVIPRPLRRRSPRCTAARSKKTAWAGVGANKLLKYWPPALTEWPTKGVRDAFFSSPQLPRLLDADAVKRTIADGVSRGTLGYVMKDSSGQLKLSHFNESLNDADVDIADDVFILKAEDAQKLLEPARLDRISVRPGDVVLKPGEQASFSCDGIDQYGQPFAVGSTKWSTTGSSITDDGLYEVDKDSSGGLFTVKAEAGGLESIAEIRVKLPSKEDDDGGDDDQPPTSKSIHWHGEVPPQKWTNFYTKVLSRFASAEGLKLNVSFEVPAEGEQGKAKADEARSGLKELGLDDDVRLG